MSGGHSLDRTDTDHLGRGIQISFQEMRLDVQQAEDDSERSLMQNLAPESLCQLLPLCTITAQIAGMEKHIGRHESEEECRVFSLSAELPTIFYFGAGAKTTALQECHVAAGNPPLKFKIRLTALLCELQT